jgi:hypothetical protein
LWSGCCAVRETPAVGAGKRTCHDRGDFAFHFGDDFLHAVNDLVDGLFLAAVIEDEGGAVIAIVRVHFGSLRLSWFMAGSTPRDSSGR